FFALGGHSLTAIRVQHQIQNRMGIDLPVEIFFEFRTIASLAPSIDGLFSHTTEALPSADPMALLNGTAQKLPLDGVAAQVDPNQESQEWIETKL
ncbi:MAG: acyl carrier protein, partial [Caldilineaceae bacterium]|nr:acyl carrier protein [Caldilineaceae bacterium]